MSRESDKRLFLLDAMALIYRAYYAFSKRPLVNSKGMNTSAIAGFVNTLLELLRKENPSHIAVVFDTAAPTGRHTEYEAYKANRQETPEDILSAIPYVKEILRGFKIPALERDGYEADDIIGTLAKQAEKKGYSVYMVTPDKDFGQLVSDHVVIYKPAYAGSGFEVMDKEAVLKRWEIKDIGQVVDILGLMGDAVDNIPGVPGVGEKTARKLIQEYGSVEEVIKHAGSIPGKLSDKIKEHKDQALLSKKLATILCDVPVPFDEKDLTREEPDREKLSALFTELEFRTIGKKALGGEFSVNAPSASPQAVPASSRSAQGGLFDGETAGAQEEEKTPAGKNISNTLHEYRLAGSSAERRELIKTLAKHKSFCFDTETTGLDPITADIVGMSFSIEPHKGWYVPAPAGFEKAKDLLHEFREIFEDEKTEITGQNLKYDLLILRRYGIHVKGKLFDTMLAHYLLEPEMRHNMDLLSETYLGYTPVPIEDLIGKKGKGQLSMRDVPEEKVAEYAAEDADITLQLRQKFEPALDEKGVRKLFDDTECPLVQVLAGMEYEGVRVDRSFLEDYSAELGKDLMRIEHDIKKMAGMDFNIASPKQLGEVLFERMKLGGTKKTRTGQYATDEDTLLSLAGEHEIVKKILDCRELSKLKSTYVDALPRLINPGTGRVHTSFNQAVAATGRLSSNNPNMQNIPVRTDRGREIRKAFIPRNKDYVLLSADYSQIELRIVAALSKDESMLEDFRKGLDVHAATASKVYGAAPGAVTDEMRRNAKMVNFGIVYGISAFGLSQRLGIPRGEAATLIENYFSQYPGIKRYMVESVSFARKHGYVQTLMGRRRYIRDIHSRNANVRGFAERNAINTPVQGTAADMIKIAMVNIHRELEDRQSKTRMILQVHDELLFDAHHSEVKDLKPVIEEKMKTAIPMEVPIVVEAGTGENWLEAH